MPYAVRRKTLSHAAVAASGGGGSSRNAKRKNVGKRNQINEVVIKDPIDKIRDAASGVVGKLSKYVGGFIRKGNRMNNSKAYNHDYYMHNKWRWHAKKTGATGLKDWRQHFALARYSKTKPDMPCTVKDESSWEAYKKQYKDVLNYKNPFHKYIYKVLQANGKFRYFYTNAKFSKLLADLPQKLHRSTIQEDMSAVNIAYSSQQVTPRGANTLHTENCGFCTIAYDLRRRGYDVKAIPNDDGISSFDIPNLYKQKDGTKRDLSYVITSENKTSSGYTHDLFDQLAKTGNGASGAVSVKWHNGGGHSLAYQVVKGKAYILDCQTNTIYDEQDFSTLLADSVNWRAYRTEDTGEPVGPTYVRLDDMDIDDDAVHDGSIHDGIWTVHDNKRRIGTFSKDVESNAYADYMRAIAANGATRSENNQADLKEGEKIVSYQMYEGKDNTHGRTTVTREGKWYGTRYMSPTAEDIYGRKPN